MYQPRPHGLATVGGDLTDEDSAAIELLARRLTNLKTLSGLDSMRMVRSLPDGGHVVMQDMGGVFKAIASKPKFAAEKQEHDGLAHANVPMLFSGVVTSAVTTGDAGLGIKLTEQTRKRLASYGSNLPAKDVRLQRFRIGYHTMVWELGSTVETTAVYSQYAAQRPSWYSGAMAEVMQIVGGYGKQRFDEKPDDPMEMATMKIPEKVMVKIRNEIGNVRLPGYTGFPNETGQFLYDYKFDNTNGVAFDSERKPWLIRVSSAGVHAMPLPLIPATTTKAFREYVEDVGDDELLAILDRFGGMPSGESFPLIGRDFEAWRRAGVVIKICDTSDFYDHIMYSSACGWSFNTKGTEGYNTCYDYYDDEGLGYGLTYKLTLKLGTSENSGKLSQSLDLEDPEEARLLDAYLSSIYQRLTDSHEHRAIKYKIRRATVSELLERGEHYGADPESEVRYWNTKEFPPIATHHGSVTEVSRGYLYHGAKFQFQPQIKFPEPYEGGCISHDFLPLENGRYKDSYPNCDTIMFCYYIGDDLKVVKYFRDGRSFQREAENDYEPCMTVGSWQQTVTEGLTSLVGHFYTSDIDERKELAPVVTTTNIKGMDRGYDSVPQFGFDDIFSSCGTIWRNRYFSHQTVEERTEGSGIDVAVCIPYLSRNALLHAKKEYVTGKKKTEGAALYAIQDPNTYRYYTYHFVFAWVGCADGHKGNVASATNVSPAPNNGNPVWVTGYNYHPGGCSDFADQGNWLGELPQDYTWLIWPVASEYNVNGGGGAPPFRSYSTTRETGGETTGEIFASIRASTDLVSRDIPDNMYFLGSPDELVGVFYRDACRVEFGSSEYCNVSERDSNGGRARWGFTSLASHTSAHHFLGVINE